jgi:hypothetical protein
MPLMGDRDPLQKPAMFLRPTWDERGLGMRGLGYARCLDLQLSGGQGTRPWAPL